MRNKAFEDPHTSIQSVRSITFEQWWKKKEMMQRLKDKLVEDAKLEVLQQITEKQMDETKQTKSSSYFSNYSFLISIIEEWCKAKDKEQRMKRRFKKRKEMMEKMKEIRKRQNANKGFKEWLKTNLFKAKQENKFKQTYKKEKK